MGKSCWVLMVIERLIRDEIQMLGPTRYLVLAWSCELRSWMNGAIDRLWWSRHVQILWMGFATAIERPYRENRGEQLWPPPHRLISLTKCGWTSSVVLGSAVGKTTAARALSYRPTEEGMKIKSNLQIVLQLSVT